MNLVKKWIVNWAVTHHGVEAVVCFGSSARGDDAPSSDVDLCILGQDVDPEALKHDLLDDFVDSICYTSKETHKLVAFLSQAHSETCVRLDCFIVPSLDIVEKYIVGSEMSIDCMKRILLFKRDGSGCEEWLIKTISKSPVADQIDFSRKLIMKFIESFEAASNKRAVGDKYLFLFQLFLAHDALLKLEFIRQGGQKFLYQPKMVLPFLDKFDHPTGVTVSRHFEDVLEPRGRLNFGHSLQVKYLEQFRITVGALTEEDPAYLHGIAPTIDTIVHILAKFLKRDRYYNFRDASQGSMKCRVVYRSGLCDLRSIIEEYQIAAVLDLRSQGEVDVEPVDLSNCNGVVRMHVDLFECGKAEDMAISTNCQSDATVTADSKYHSFTTHGRCALGFALRSVLHAPLPILVHGLAGKDRTGVVIALLQLLCGMTRDLVIRDYMSSLQGVRETDICMFLDAVSGNQLVGFLLSCGLTLQDIIALRNKLTDNTEGLSSHINNLSKEAMFCFHHGRPQVACRPYLACELQAMKRTMLHNVPVQQEQPWAVIITGLPASGKSTLSRWILADLRKSPDDFVNIDMDFARVFHCQYQHFRHLSDTTSGGNMLSYEELVPWFNDGTNIEQILYSEPNGVVQTLLANKSNFILPAVIRNGRTLQFIRCCVEKHGYHPVLVGVHVSEDVAIARTKRRNQLTGRFMPLNLIENQSETIQRSFAEMAQYVVDSSGSVYLYKNDTNIVPEEIVLSEAFSYHQGTKKVSDLDLAEAYGVIAVAPQKQSTDPSADVIAIGELDSKASAATQCVSDGDR